MLKNWASYIPMISAFRGSNRTCSEVSIRAGNHEICHLLYCFFPLLHNSLTTINVTVSKRLWCGRRELTGMQNYLVALAKWIFVNFHGKFRLGIPNHNNSGSKNLEIPRNSQKFQVYSHSEHQWLSLKSCKFKKFLGISRNV